MRVLLSTNIKLAKRVSTVNFLRNLIRLRIGTNDAEKVCESLQRNFARKTGGRRIVSIAMRLKLADAEWCEREIRREFYQHKNEYYSVVRKNSYIDYEFSELMKYEVGVHWNIRSAENKRRISWLLKKWGNREIDEANEVRGVKYKDEDLIGPEIDKNSESVAYGGVEITENMTEVLTMNPNMMTYEKIDPVKMEMEIEKGFFKARYEFMGRDQKNESQTDREESDPTETLDLENKSVDYSKLRATNLPTCTRLKVPKPGSVREEAVMSGLKEKLMDEIRNYVKEECNEKGWPESNLTQSEQAGLRELREKIDKKEIVVFKTDKSGKLAVDTPENYSEAITVHTANDEEIDDSKLRKIETSMNDHLRQLNKIFEVGAKWNHQDRVAEASTSTNVPAPSLYGLRKDHKNVPPGGEEKGPPLRPICSAREAPNSRMSGFISKVIYDFADSIDDHHEVRSSEEMRAGFEEFNNNVDEATRKKCKIKSADIKALFPSMSVKLSRLAVKKMILKSDLKIRNVNNWELVKFVAVTIADSEIEEMGLERCIPKRAKKNTRKLTMNCLKSDKNDNLDWIPAETEPDETQTRLLVALTLSYCVEVVMRNHTYKLGDRTFLQSEGGPIGLELTGAVSRAFMMMWDELYLNAVETAGLRMLFYKRYVDDSNQIVVDDNNSEDGEDLALKLKNIANSVMEGIEVEMDLPSRHRDGKMPILDMKVHINHEGFVIYEHYEKPVSSKLVISERSAHSGGCKRSVHISELVRRMYNTSRRLDWDAYTAPVLTDYLQRMKTAGYSEKYRRSVLVTALGVYDFRVQEELDGVRPFNRPNGYKKSERKAEKKKKQQRWASSGGFTAPIIIPATPGGELARRLREITEREKEPGVSFKVVERGGKTLARQLQSPNPTAKRNCSKTDCIPCSEPGGGRLCHKNNVTYQYTCKVCEAVYTGETSRNLYTRALEHEMKHQKKKPDSFINNHQVESHEGVDPNFSVRVVGSYKDPLSRQVAEGVLITNTKTKVLNSKSEIRQPPIVRLRREVGMGN